MQVVLENLILIAALSGCVMAALCGFGWDSLPSIRFIASSDIGKIISSAIKFLCALYLAVIASTSGTDRNPVTPFASAASVFIWDLVEITVKRKEARAAEDIATLNLTLRRRANLLACFQSLVGDKINLIRSEVSKMRPESRKAYSIRKAFGNKDHVDNLLEQIVLYFSKFDGTLADDPALNVRAGFYVAVGDQLEVVSSYDLKLKAHAVLRSFRDHPERFNLTTLNRRSRAVICILDGRTIIVEDGEKELDYDRDEQKNYLKSLVAHPISGYGAVASPGIQCCLVVDSNVVRFFREEDRKEIELVLENFAHRLRLEFVVKELIHNKSQA